MTGHELCAVFIAMKLHFTVENFNYFQSSGKTKIGVDAFQKRKDKYFFHKLSRQLKDEEIVPFLVSNLIRDDFKWSRDLVQESAKDAYRQWQTTMESLSYKFEQDLKKIREQGSWRDMFVVKDGEYPKALVMYMHKEIHLETLVVLNILTGFLQVWDSKISDTIIYPKISFKIRKYQPFFSVNAEKMKAIVKKVLKDDG